MAFVLILWLAALSRQQPGPCTATAEDIAVRNRPEYEPREPAVVSVMLANGDGYITAAV